MRILQVNSAAAWGGGETHLAGLLAGLRARGHDVFTAGRPTGAIAADYPFAFRNLLDLITVTRLRALLRTTPFDIVHAHLGRDYPLVCAAAAGLPRTRVVCTRHLLYPLRRNPLYARVNGWIAPSRPIADEVRRLRPRRLAMIPHGIEPQKFPFQPHPPHTLLTLGLLGQISPHKGHDDAIAALRELGPGYQLFIAGQGRESYLRQLQSSARGLRVEFRAFTSPEEFFPEIDILLLPSWDEPFGLVILEAMAAGVPVIASNRGGSADIIASGQDGILIPPHSPSALAAAIHALTRDHSAMSALALRARKKIEAEFTLDTMIRRVEEFYRELLAA